MSNIPDAKYHHLLDRVMHVPVCNIHKTFILLTSRRIYHRSLAGQD